MIVDHEVRVLLNVPLRMMNNRVQANRRARREEVLAEARKERERRERHDYSMSEDKLENDLCALIDALKSV